MMRLLLLGVAFVLLGCHPGAASTGTATVVAGKAEDKTWTHEELLREKTRLQEEVTAIFQSVQDQSTAEQALARLKQAQASLKALQEPAQKLPAPDAELKKKLKESAFPLLMKSGNSLVAAHDQLFHKHPNLYRVLEKTEMVKEIQKEQEERADSMARDFKEALEICVKDKYSVGAVGDEGLPSSLSDVLQMKNKPLGFMLTSDKDPWGKVFQFSIGPLELLDKPDDLPRKVHVWTTSPYGNGKKVIGNKP